MGFRYLTTGEIALAQTVFGTSINYSQVKIYNEKFNIFQPDDRAISPDGNIYFSPSDVRYTSDFSLASRDVRGIFIHEMSHVWQLPNYASPSDFQKFALSQRSYNYDSIFSGKPFNELQIEQQAAFLQDLYRLRDGAILNGKPSLAAYEQALPDDFTSSTYTTIIIYQDQHYNLLRPESGGENLIDYMTSLTSKFFSSINVVSPLVLDLNNNGIELTALNKQGAVYWDGDNDGFREASGWVRGGDGLLVRDVNGNGTIDNNSELFGNDAIYANGFLNLKSLDSNNDNIITAADTNFGALKVWVDANQDGVSQASELSTLATLGITQINLAYAASATQIAGNDIKQTSSFVQNGVTKTIVDAWFANDQVNSVYDGNYTLDTTTLFMPTLRGYGSLPDLHIAMSQDATLLTAMQTFTANSIQNLLNPATSAYSDFKSILYKWAGVESVVDGSRGTFINAKDLAFYEKIMGQGFYQTANATPNPLEPAADSLNQGLKILFDNLYARILFQVGGSEFFAAKPAYNPITDSFEGANATLNLVNIQTAFAGTNLPPHQLAQSWLTVIGMMDKAYDLTLLSEGDKFGLKNIIASSDPTGSITFDGLLAQVNATAVITSGTANADVIIGDVVNNTIHGNNGNDVIFGGAKRDYIYGESGNDVIIGKGGDDYLRGDDGNDTYVIRPSEGGVAEVNDYVGGVDTIYIDGAYTIGQITTARTPTGVNKEFSMDIFASGVKIAEVDYQFNTGASRIEFIKLSDGSIIDLSAIQYTTTGTASGEIIYGIKSGAIPDDTINGLGGNDTIYGYDGNDRLNGGAGADTLYGANGNDTYVIASGEGGDTINEEFLGGNDTIEFTGTGLTNANLQLLQSGSNLQIEFSGILYATIINYYKLGGEIETIKFSDGTTKDMTSIDWTLLGTAAGEFLDATGSTSAGNHRDIIYGYAGADTIRGYAGNDTLYGGDGNDAIYGGDNNDTLFGENDVDTLRGENGDDRLDGGAGADLLYGGADNDTYVIVAGQGADTIYEAGNGGKDTIEFTGDASWILSNFSAVSISGNISLRFSGVEVGVINSGFVAGYEIENIKFNDGTVYNFSAYEWLYNGTTGADTITANAGNIINVIYGLGGNDVISSFLGNDKLYGGDGNDTLNGGNDNDLLNGGLGDDSINGENGNDTVTYSDATAGVTVNLSLTTAQNTIGAGIDTILTVENIIGSTFNDTLTGDANANVIEGGLGDDVLNGGAGIDTLSYSTATAGVTINLATLTSQNTVAAGNDTITGFENVAGTSFNDTITGDANANVIEGGAGDDVLNGGAGTDTVTYVNALSGVTVNLATTTAQNTIGAGTDTVTLFENLIGSAYNDTITGNTGNNVIEGGLGNDILNGAAGTDTLSYANSSAGIVINLATTTAQNTIGAGIDTVSNFENIIGSAFNDTLTGTTGNNVIDGGAGDDIIDGGSGTDTLSYASSLSAVTASLALTIAQNTVGAGIDTISSFENLTGSALNDTLSGNSSANTIDAGLGNDLVYADLGDDVLNGNTGTDTLSFANIGNSITFNLTTTTAQTTGAGLDTITNFENIIGSAYNDTLTGNTSNNVIEGGLGNDILDGSTGTDTVSYLNSIAGVQVDLSIVTAQSTFGAGIDTLLGFENLTGSAYDDILSGNSGVNTIDAGLGNDLVYADAGNDILNGNTGSDTLSFDKILSSVTFNLATLTSQNTGTGSGSDTVTGFENVIGSTLNDTITGDANANIIEGGLGTDVLDGAAGVDTASYLHAASAVTVNLSLTTAQNTFGGGSDTLTNFENLTGSAFDDDLTGNTAANTIDGGSGNDIIHGGLGNDILIGGLGIDTVSYSDSAALVTVNLATTGSQNTGTGSGTDTLSGFENLIGSSLNDTLTGDANNNMIEGGLGNDIINGAGGIDTISYAGATSGVAVNLSLTTSQNTVGAGADTITNFENIFASAYSDTLTGDANANVINGRGGADTLIGGLGADTFVFDTSTLGATDAVSDFSISQGDKLDISNVLVGYNSLQSAIDDFITLTSVGGNTTVSVDRDGAGTAYTAQTVATLTGVTGLDADTMLQNGNLIT